MDDETHSTDVSQYAASRLCGLSLVCDLDGNDEQDEANDDCPGMEDRMHKAILCLVPSAVLRGRRAIGKGEDRHAEKQRRTVWKIAP